MTHLPYESTHPLGYGVYTRLIPLPDGWEWIQSHNHWLLARSPDSRFYFANFPAGGGILLILRRRAGFFDWLRTVGRIPPGTYFADYRFTIWMPPPKSA